MEGNTCHVEGKANRDGTAGSSYLDVSLCGRKFAVCLRRLTTGASVLSAFEESSAACIKDMSRYGPSLEAIRMAEKIALHIEVLFATIDDLEWHFSHLGIKGMLSALHDCFVPTIASRLVTCQGSSHALPQDNRSVHLPLTHSEDWCISSGHESGISHCGHRTRTLPQNPHSRGTHRRSQA